MPVLDEASELDVTSSEVGVPVQRGRGRAGSGNSLRDKAYEEIKRRVITLLFRPGEYLNEAYVSELLGIGRTPVHQAFARLEIDGLVEVVPRVGIMVRPLSLDEILDLIDVRQVNEVHCAGRAAERATAGDVAAMKAVLNKAPALLEKSDIEGLMQVDRQFHSVLAQSARSPVLADLLLTLHERSLRYWFLSLSTDAHSKDVHDEHMRIVSAIERRDGDAAREFMRSHINAFHKIIHDRF